MKQPFTKDINQPVQQYPVQRWRGGELMQATDQLAEEVPVALVYNGVSHAVMLASPQDLEDFALGFSLTEGILQDKSELYGVEIQAQENGIELQLEISTEQFVKLKEHRRNIAGRTGCGLCGAESLTQVFRLPAVSDAAVALQPISMHSVFKAHDSIRALQPMQQQTGATHACAWADSDGAIQYVREDVGRHNALDKLLGVLCKQEVKGGFILTSSRASYEMVQKVTMMGFDLLAAISAPTGLAVRIAEEYGVTLLGFVRDQQYVAYSHANRMTE
ncbi:MAG: formate dehydrogenase accessory sulfurtransferase FdhD [Methylophilaceae bacterium]|jgi:FdhD protein|nr:formate dehydrogenase accessory sulfurtransferase FdhD [Methylophilaceae bacterium]